MRRSIFFNFRHFSTKKVSDILGKSSTASKTKSKVSELTEILANRRPPPRTLKQASENANKPKLSPEERLVGAEMAQAASKVGEILGDGEKIKSDLLKKLIEIDRETFDLSKPASQNVVQEEESTTTTNFLSTLSNMTIANEEKEKTETELFFEREKEFLTNIGLKLKVERQKNLEKRTKLQSSVECQFVDFLKGDRLNLFDDQMEIGSQAQEKPILNPIWEKCRLKHLTWLTDVQPRNGFEEMIEWTEKGRMYPYPIDNEYGFHEKFIPFHEHVFLNRCLENDHRVPRDGPVRHFLDAVCLGLSKNPYMKLERKKEHIEWYKDYFKDKIHLIEKMQENEDQLRD